MTHCLVCEVYVSFKNVIKNMTLVLSHHNHLGKLGTLIIDLRKTKTYDVFQKQHWCFSAKNILDTSCP